MSSKRKFSRAQAARSKAQAPAAADKSRTELRRELATERFKKPGSDALWVALLGWSAERVDRIWLLQALNDAAHSGQAADGVKRSLAERAPALVDRVASEDLERAIELWREAGDEYTPGEPSAKWHYLSALAARNGLGEPTAEELQEDWEAWTSLRLAAPLRTAIMNALGQSEQAAVALGAMTQSENASAIVNVMRCTWTALAYGDARAFEKIRKLSDEWLAG